MAAVVKVRRRVNPHRAGGRRKKRNPKRHKMTPRQIKFFGTKAQKAGLKRRNKARRHASTGKHKRRRTINPVHRRASTRKHRRRTTNPALLITLGAVNPRKRRKVVARKRHAKKSNPTHRRRRSRNATRVVVTAPRRRNRRIVRHIRRGGRRRNPQLFGASVSTTQMVQAVAGGLVGVAAAKFIPTVLPSQLVSSNLMRTVTTGASAVAVGMLAQKFVKGAFGQAVLFGGLMQTGSVALNAFLPSVASMIGVSGMGELVDARFSIPENPIRMGAPAPVVAVNARAGVSGLNRAFGNAF